MVDRYLSEVVYDPRAACYTVSANLVVAVRKGAAKESPAQSHHSPCAKSPFSHNVRRKRCARQAKATSYAFVPTS
eukprot:2382447-Rhodomonas_salina.2